MIDFDGVDNKKYIIKLKACTSAKIEHYFTLSMVFTLLKKYLDFKISKTRFDI